MNTSGDVADPNVPRAALPLVMAALAALLLVLTVTGRPPAPRPADAPADVFSAGRAIAILDTLIAERVPHPVGTPANAVVRDRILEHLRALGLEPEIHRSFACRDRGGMCAPVENIIARMPGTTDAPAVALSAHYDSRGAGPGAADDGAGIAAILEIARIARAEGPYANPVVLLLTDGEEAGLLGAEAFAREHPLADSIGVVINLEARGSGGPSIMFETSDRNAWLVELFGDAAEHPVANSLTYEVYRLLPNDTDATVYRRMGAAVLNFAFVNDVVHYHSVHDDIEHLDARSVQHHGENALAALRATAAAPLADRAALEDAGDAVYTDLFGRVLLHWPVSWMLPLALLLTVTVLVTIGVMVRRRRITPAALGFATAAALLGLVLAIAAGIAIGALLGAATGGRLLHAYPQPAFIALWSGALAAVLLPAGAVARRSGGAALLAAASLLFSILTILLAALLPGAAVVLVIPQFFALAALILLTFQPERLVLAAGVAAVGAGLSLIRIALLLQSVFALAMPVAITGVIGLAALPLAPLVATGPSRARRLAPAGAAAAVAVIALVAAMLVPGYSEWRPQQLNTVYVEQTGADSAVWTLQGPSATEAVPAGLRAAADFTDAPALPFTAAEVPTAVAPVAGLAPPRLDVLAVDTADGRMSVLLRAVSPRGANRFVLLVPEHAALHVEGFATGGLTAPMPDHRLYVLHGMSPEGVRVEISYPPGVALPVTFYDISPGLPAAGAPLRAARPATAAPFGDGDVSVAVAGIVLPGTLTESATVAR